MIQHELFESFSPPITEAKLYTTYQMSLLKKAKPSDGIGDYHGNKANGISLYSMVAKDKRDKINSIFLYGKGHKGFQPFTGDLPNGISFEMTRTEVKKLLGKPDWSIEIGGVGIMANIASADKWFTKNKEGFRVEYTPDEKYISIISLSCAEQEAEWAS
jgi:hypothetical protein